MWTKLPEPDADAAQEPLGTFRKPRNPPDPSPEPGLKLHRIAANKDFLLGKRSGVKRTQSKPRSDHTQPTNCTNMHVITCPCVCLTSRSPTISESTNSIYTLPVFNALSLKLCLSMFHLCAKTCFSRACCTCSSRP